MSEIRIANRYAKSLLQEAQSRNAVDAVYQDMQLIANTCTESKDLTNLLRSPVIKESVKLEVLKQVFPSINDLSKSLLTLLVNARRESHLAAIAKAYNAQYHELKGIAEATVTSAYQLDAPALSTIERYLAGKLGKTEIRLKNIVDKKVIGGMVIRYEDKLLDMSVAKELKEIRKQLIYN